MKQFVAGDLFGLAESSKVTPMMLCQTSFEVCLVQYYIPETKIQRYIPSLASLQHQNVRHNLLMAIPEQVESDKEVVSVRRSNLIVRVLL